LNVFVTDSHFKQPRRLRSEFQFFSVGHVLALSGHDAGRSVHSMPSNVDFCAALLAAVCAE
jgi:hypothetical protein